MQHFYRVIFFLFSFFPALLFSQVTVTNPGNTTPALAATYTSLANAITALQTITAISGPVTFTLAAGNPQTAPVGGYEIRFAATTTAARNITFIGNSNTITANAALVSGSLTDGIFKIIGADFITIQNFALRENAANTTTAAATNNMTEWGIALLRASATNGAQNNVINNNNIQLNRAYSNSFGIYSNTRHTSIAPAVATDITNVSGANSSNDILSNSISNVNFGICLIGSGVADYMDLSNEVGASSAGNGISNWGGQQAASSFVSMPAGCYAVLLNNQKSETASFNTINSATLSGTSVSVRGIYKTYSANPTGTFSSTINSNTLTITHNFGSGLLELIASDGVTVPLATASLTINQNWLRNNAVGGTNSSTTLTCISNASHIGTLNINGNQFTGNISAATTGGFVAINNIGDVQTAVNIVFNNIGTMPAGSGIAIGFSAATSGSLVGINAAVGNNASLVIDRNSFTGFVQLVAGTSSCSHTYINFTHSSASAVTDYIGANEFASLTANTQGDVVFIKRSGIMAAAAGATEACSYNYITGAFSKTAAGGTVTFYSATSGSLSGNTMVHNFNGFVDVTVTGNTTINGWVNTEGGLSGPTKTITGNIFSNWTGGTGALVGIRTDYSGNNTVVNSNTISNISSGGAVTGLSIGSNNKGTVQTYSDNDISGLSSTGGGNVLGIFGGSASITTLNINNNTISNISSNVAGSFSALRMFTAATANIFKNKIFDIAGAGASSLVNGIDVQSAAIGTYNIHNNIIGNLTATTTSSTTAIRGISLLSVNAGTSYNVFYNTVYINAASSGANFGTAAFSASVSATAANGVLSLRNNIFVNTSVANGSGFTMAYRRSGTDLTNFATASNNNIFYAGTPSVTNVIFSDGTNTEQTLAGYKTRVGPTRDAASFTELPPFISTTGSNAGFLHIDPLATTQAESGAVNIASYTDDFDGNIRQGNAGYAGIGTAPDIGADEIANDATAPVITYTTISSPICVVSGMTISGVTITDATGIPLSGTLRPRIYFRKNAGAWFSQPGTNTAGTTKNSTWTFAITEASMGGVVAGDVVSYYIIAQDIMPTPNIGANPGTGLVATNVNTVTTAPISPNTYTVSNSLNGLYKIGPGGHFATLSIAINAYNTSCSLGGHVIFELMDNSATAGISISNNADASETKTLTIRREAGVMEDIPGGITFNGARYVTVEGRAGGTDASTEMAIGGTVSFQNDAKYCTVQYCSIVTGGSIIFGAANAAGTGNDYNKVDHNRIDGLGFIRYPVRSSGTLSRSNTGNVISNNTISNYYDPSLEAAGVSIGDYSDSFLIAGNRLYQTQERYYTIATKQYGVLIRGNTYNNIVRDNVIGFADEAGTGTTVMIGNTALIPGFPDNYTSGATATQLSYTGIAVEGDLTSAQIINNTIGGIAMYTAGRPADHYFFSAIAALGSSAAPRVSRIDSNTIGSITDNRSIYLATTSSGEVAAGVFAEYYTVSASFSDNTVGGIAVSGVSGTTGANFHVFDYGWVYGTSLETHRNRIGNTNPLNIQTGLLMSGAQLSRNGTLQPTTGIANIKGIFSTGGASNNVLQGWAVSGATAEITGIYGGDVTGAGISLNSFGTSTVPWVHYAASSAGKLTGIELGVSTFTGTSTVYANQFYNLSYAGAASNSGELAFIETVNSLVSPRTVIIDNNVFNTLSLKSNNTKLIKSNARLSATGKLEILNNRSAGGISVSGTTGEFSIVKIENDNAAGSSIAVRNNNFSSALSVTATGNFSCTGIYCNETNAANNGYATKKITGNSFLNMSGGRGDQAIMALGNFGSTTADSVSNNLILGITANEGDLFGIKIGAVYTGQNAQSAANNIVVKSNSIASLTATGSNKNIAGISIGNDVSLTGVLSIEKNWVRSLTHSGTGATASGIRTSLNARVDIFNNIMGNFFAPNANDPAEPSVTGIHYTSATAPFMPAYNNSIYINGSGTSPSFSTAAIYSFSGQRYMQNNLLVNVASPGASGKSVVFWNNGGSETNYSSLSNYNLMYAGTPAANRLIYFNGVSGDQTLAAFKTRVGPSRDSASISQLPDFLSTDPNMFAYLHLNVFSNCGIINGGNNDNNMLSTDFDDEERLVGPPAGAAIDIGADETTQHELCKKPNKSSTFFKV